ncbi:hypothetical protein NP233_g8537 [Leucocoprinus birnbaumii]|uniref:DDE Tnp4 domain-containing protein n=1 Tax=Leucocoprinus birnbaumii TaxID=56174 RepID=A0AAD5YN21_9AGAR|nr:hypothetical protein NP233_g8537 [Leucocoprinus birnbaumii]
MVGVWLMVHLLVSISGLTGTAKVISTVVSMPNLRIIDVGYGFTGSTHDASAWQKTRIYSEKERYLEGNEFIWADSAYPIEEWLVAPYKKPEHDEPENELFNNHLSMIRIRSEHAIGFLKGRFQSLKDLRILIRNAETHKLATYWVLACVAVHSFAMEIEAEERGLSSADENDPFIVEGLSSDPNSDDDERGLRSGQRRKDGSQRTQAARARRESLKAKLFQAIGYDSSEDEE